VRSGDEADLRLGESVPGLVILDWMRRRALSKGRERDPIRTVRGLGYAFDENFDSGRSR
jgi:hypothetical protein